MNDTVYVPVTIGTFALISAGVLQNGSSLTADATGGNPPYTFYWSDGSTGQTITITSSGYFMVTITDENGCTATAISDSVVYETVAGEVSNAGFSIMPNPADQWLIISFNQTQLPGETLAVYNALGQKIFATFFSERKLKIDISTLGAGVYSLRCGNTVKKFVVKR
jgi:hypothetical protein